MKSVDLTTDMRPWRAGDTIHIPDAVAETLVKAGEAKNMRPFTPPNSAESSKGDDRPRNTYLTKGKKG